MSTAADCADLIGEPAPRIETVKLPGERTRAKPMAKSPLGKSRTWLCDGEYVWFRRARANAATLERHEKFVRTGQYKHVGNSDDVEIWQLTESSAFKRTPVNLGELNLGSLRRTGVLLAVAGDFSGYVDALDELASRIKGVRGGELDEGTRRKAFLAHVGHMNYLIQIRGGPSPMQIEREIASVRARRGQGKSRQILLPVA